MSSWYWRNPRKPSNRYWATEKPMIIFFHGKSGRSRTFANRWFQVSDMVLCGNTPVWECSYLKEVHLAGNVCKITWLSEWTIATLTERLLPTNNARQAVLPAS